MNTIQYKVPVEHRVVHVNRPFVETCARFESRMGKLELRSMRIAGN